MKENMQFNFLKLNPPFRTYFGKSPIWTLLPPPLKMKTTPKHKQKYFLENQKIPPLFRWEDTVMRCS